jgi:hypothetical protein
MRIPTYGNQDAKELSMVFQELAHPRDAKCSPSHVYALIAIPHKCSVHCCHSRLHRDDDDARDLLGLFVKRCR